jgi:two-component system CheB/CheR fusion protein
VGTNGGTQLVDITIQRIEKPEAVKGMIMVVFTDVPAPAVSSATKNLKTGKPKLSEKQMRLESELKRYQEDFLLMREEMQTSQEELKLANEELQSTNEELQSTNEELSTSREEMQSLNEELQTVNIELQRKINEYAHTHDDLKNLLNSIEIATLFLDKDLNIRRFTDKLSNIIKIRNSDIGRPFTDLVNDLAYPEIENHARRVLETLKSFESEIATHNGKWFSIRIMPYRTTDDRIDGLVLTFSEITGYKNLEMELLKANKMLRDRQDNT